MTEPAAATDRRGVPRAEYERRLQECRRQTAELGRPEHLLGTARVVFFLIALVAIAILASWGVLLVVVTAGLALSGIFAVLVTLHYRVLVRLGRADRAARFYERGLARITDRWAGGGETGERYVREDHPYAADLDLFGRGSLFELLCTARTRPGEDTLAGWLQGPGSPAEIIGRQEAVRDLRPRLKLREDLALLGADVPSGVDFAELIAWGGEAQPPVSVGVRAAAGWLGILAVAGILAWIEWGTPLPLLAAFGVQYWFTSRLRPRVQAIVNTVEKRAGDLTLLAGILARVENESFAPPRLTHLQASLRTGGQPPSRRIRELVRMIDWLNARYNPFFAPIGVLVLWTTQWALRIETWRARIGPALGRWLSAVGEFEALAALAAYAYENPDDPFPEITGEGPWFEGTGLAHPLLPPATAVRNDLSLGRDVRVYVVSGSNMSGKSTLLRTVGVNAVLALAGAPVRATSLRLSPVMLGATLRIQDSLQAGRSRFFTEITRLRRLLDLTAGPLPLLFLLDEILHGTNSHDRRLGAEGVIRSFVAHGALGLVTTHDLALTHLVDLLKPHATNIHFADQFENGQLTFDYRIRPGIAGHGNALDLMRAVGLDV